MLDKEILALDSDYERYKKVLDLSDDQLKLKYLSFIKSESYKALVISSLKSDEDKIHFLLYIEDDYSRYLIIKSLISEEYKVKYVSLILSEDFRVLVILSLNSDINKENLLYTIKSDYYLANVISSFKSDLLKKKYLHELKDFSWVRVVSSLESDEDKYKYLTSIIITNEDWISMIVSSFKKDEYILKGLNLLTHDQLKISAIARLDSVENMVKALKEIEDDMIRLSITLEISEEKKIKLISCLEGSLKVQVIASLHDSSKKLSYLKEIDDAKERMIVLISLSDLEKEKIIQTYLPYQEKIALIYSLKDRNKREFWINLWEKEITFDLGIDPTIKFGLEIEVEGINFKVIQNREVDQCGYLGTYDGTLINGVEVKTPILVNQYKDLNELYYVFVMLYYGGFRASFRCGGHIHFDASYLKRKEEYLALFSIWKSCEEIFYLISNQEGEIPRKEVVNFACPLLKSFEEFKEEDLNLNDEDFIFRLHSWQITKYNSVNLIHVCNGMNTIEFRVSNGSNNFVTWMQNIGLFARLLMASKRAVEEEKLWNLKELLKLDLKEEEKLEILLDLLFEEDKRKEVYRDRYYTNKELLDKNKNHPLNQLELSRRRNN